MLARITSPALFGEALALLAIMLIIEAPTTALQALVAGAVERNRKRAEDLTAELDIGSLIAAALAGGVVLCAVLMAAMVPVGSFLRLRSTPYLVAVYAFPLMLGIVPKGILSGLMDYRGLARGLLASSCVRLVAGTALVHMGYGLQGALGAVVIGEVVASLLLLATARRRTSGSGRGLDLMWRKAVAEGAASTGFWLLAALDIALARHYLPASRAGLYAAAATLAQLVMILPGAAAAWFFPRLIGSKATRRNTGVLILRSAAAVAAVSFAIAAVVGWLCRPLVRLVFDANYLAAAPSTLVLLFSAAFLGVVMVLLQYLLSRHEAVPAALSWVGTVVLVVGVVINHGSVTSVGMDSLLGAATTCLAMLAVAVHGCRYLSLEPPTGDLSNLDAEIDLTVVVPYYNPGTTLAPNIRRLLTVLGNSSVDFEIIAVSDGSTDGSEATITDLPDDRLRRVVLPVNQGKGAALRVGLTAGRGRYLGFIDADGDLDPGLLETFITLVRLYAPDVVIGSKRHPLSDVHYPPLRTVYSIGFHCLTRVLFRLNVRDTQTGLKLIRRDVLAASLPRMLEKRFAFDLELLVVARRLGYRRVLEAPVVLNHQFTSTVSLRSVGNTLVDTIAIFYRLRFLRTYDRVLTADQETLRLSPVFVRGGVGLRP